MDKGRCSGGGRLVIIFYEECVEIWFGVFVVEFIVGGIDILLIDLDLLRELDDDNVDSLVEDVFVVLMEEIELVINDKVVEWR